MVPSPPPSQPVKGGKERVVTPPPVEQPPVQSPVIPVHNPEHQKKSKEEAYYRDLTAVERIGKYVCIVVLI